LREGLVLVLISLISHRRTSSHSGLASLTDRGRYLHSASQNHRHNLCLWEQVIAPTFPSRRKPHFEISGWWLGVIVIPTRRQEPARCFFCCTNITTRRSHALLVNATSQSASFWLAVFCSLCASVFKVTRHFGKPSLPVLVHGPNRGCVSFLW
jgi:hypothetical protein